MNALIYCRVSTKDQAEFGNSLEAQKEECTKFAVNEGYNIDKIFIERGESAKTTDRTELQKLIKYSVQKKKELSAVIIWKYDRLARNLSDQTELVKSFCKIGIRVLSATENNEDDSVGKLMRNIIGSFAQYENDVKSERTLSGMIQGIKEGRWQWKAPVGYKSSKDALNKPILIKDENSELVKMAFDMLESGLHKQSDILKILQKRGLKNLKRNTLSKMFRNSLYAGLIKCSIYPETVEGIHERIISKETFYKVQLILDGKKTTITPRIRNNPDFPLRNFVRCPKCDKKLTGSNSKGSNGKKYAYYHCINGCSKNIKKMDLETSFYNFLKNFQPNDDIMNLFGAIIKDVWITRNANITKEKRRLENDIDILKEKKNRIFDLLLNHTIDEKLFNEKSEEVNREIVVKTIELNETKIEINDIESLIHYCKHILGNLADLWLTSGLDQKQRFQMLIFPDKIYYENNSFRTNVTAKIIKHLRDVSALKSILVPPRGIEPLPPD